MLTNLEVRNLKNENARLKERIRQLQEQQEKPFNGDMLTLAREIRMLTRKQLSEAARIPVNAIKRFERGLATPSPFELKSLGDFLGVLPAFFFRQGRTNNENIWSCSAGSQPWPEPEAVNE